MRFDNGKRDGRFDGPAGYDKGSRVSLLLLTLLIAVTGLALLDMDDDDLDQYDRNETAVLNACVAVGAGMSGPRGVADCMAQMRAVIRDVRADRECEGGR